MNMYHLTAWDLIVMSLFIFVGYFLPTFIALIRRYNDSLGIMTLNPDFALDFRFEPVFPT